MPINFGVLNPPPVGVQTQIASPMPISNIGAQNIEARAAKTRADSEAIGNMAENLRQQKLLPGVLQGQQLTNQGLELKNTEDRMAIAASQYQIQARTAATQAYTNVKSKGGTADQALDAMEESYIKYGDAKAALDMRSVRKDIEKKSQDNNKDGLLNSAGMAYSIQQDERPGIPAIPAHKDQNGNIVPAQPAHPGISALSLYTQRYSEIKKIDSNAPDPASFKGDNIKFKNTYLTPIVEQATEPVQKLIADEKAAREDKVYTAQQVLKQRQNEFSNLLNTKGPDDPETKAAQERVDEAQTSVTREAEGNNYITGTLNSVGNFIKKHTPSAVNNYLGNVFNSTETPQKQPEQSNFPNSPTSKTIDGVTYIQQNGKWYTQ